MDNLANLWRTKQGYILALASLSLALESRLIKDYGEPGKTNKTSGLLIGTKSYLNGRRPMIFPERQR